MSMLKDMGCVEVIQKLCDYGRLVEFDANGGFDLINSKVAENPAFFDECFVKLLKEIE